MEGDLDDPIDTFLRFDALDGRSYGRRFADGPKVGPGVRDVAIRQEKSSHFTSRFDKPTFVYGTDLWRQLFTVIGLDERQAQPMPDFHEPRLKQQGVLLFLAKLANEQLEAGVEPARTKRFFDPVKCIFRHVYAIIARDRQSGCRRSMAYRSRRERL